MTETIRVLSIPELSKETGVPMFTIRKLIHEGRLPYLEIGRNRWYVKIDDFNALFKKKTE